MSTSSIEFVAFSTLIELYSCYHHLIFEYFYHSQGNATPISSHSPFLSPSQALETTNLLSVSVDLAILDSSCKWNHIVCGGLCLASFT